jgi:hypothetical protein
LLDRHKYARILPQNRFCRGAIESSYLNQQTTGRHGIYGGEHESHYHQEREDA